MDDCLTCQSRHGVSRILALRPISIAFFFFFLFLFFCFVFILFLIFSKLSSATSEPLDSENSPPPLFFPPVHLSRFDTVVCLYSFLLCCELQNTS